MAKPEPLIVVTGAAGFIGSALAWRLNQTGRKRLLLVDAADAGKAKNLEPLGYEGFVGKDEFLEGVKARRYAGVEAVLHMGACSSTTEMDLAFLARNNFEYTRALAEWCLDRSSPIRFIYASSAATYGDGRQGYADDHAGLDALRPLNPYGDSKHRFDLWARDQGVLERIVGLKYFNVYGPNEYHKGDMRSVVVKAYEQIKATGRVKLFKSRHPGYKDGEQERDFIYVKDAVEASLFFLGEGTPGGLYNVGTGRARTWLDLARALFRALGREPAVDFIPMPDALAERYQYHTQADISKLRAAGYARPFASLEDGVADYARYLEGGFKTLGH